MANNASDKQNWDLSDEKKCILLVDDDVDVLESIKAILELETPHQIVSASSKDEVEKVLQTCTPHLALLDIQLGQHSGLDLVPILRSHVADIVCIMITAHRDLEYAVTAVKLGANEYLFKPIEPVKLLKHLHDGLCTQEIEREKLKQAQLDIQKNQSDILTGLPGRELLNHHLSVSLASANRSEKTFAVMFIDLDHFKEFNDTLGHQAGDQFLVTASQKMRASLRDEEILSRFGGDEFIVVLREGTTASDAKNVAQRLLDSVTDIPMKEGQTEPVTTSIGIVLFPNDGNSSATLLNHADRAMYQAKKAGKNRYSFYEH